MFRRVLKLCKKELLQPFRNIALMLFLLYLITMDPYWVGELSMDLKDFPTGIYDLDRSTISNELVSKLRPPHFKIKYYINENREIEQLVTSGKVSMVMVIPDDFSKNVSKGKTANIQVILDGTDSYHALIALAYLGGIVGELSEKIMLEKWKFSKASLELIPMVKSNVQVLYNPNLTDSWFMSISEFLAVVVAMVGMLLPAAAAVYEKEYGNMEQLMVTPLRVYEIMLAKVISNGIIMLICATIGVYVCLKLFCQIPLKGSIPYFIFATAIFLFTATGFGLLISTLARTLSEAVLLIILILMPMWFLSGAWTPVEMMPASMQKIMRFSPMKYYIDIGYGIFLRGVGLKETWQALLQLTVLGIAVFLYGAHRFRKYFH